MSALRPVAAEEDGAALPVVAPLPPSSAAAADEVHIPSDSTTVLLAGLFVLALLASCYAAAQIALPTPMLAILKLVCCRIRPLTAISHFIEG